MMNGQKMADINNEQKKRTGPSLRFVIFFGLLIAAAIYVLVSYGILMLVSTPAAVPNKRITADRGQILDRNNRILAIQTRFGNVSVWRPGLKDIRKVADALAPILLMSADEIVERIETAASDFVYLKKQVDQATVREIEELSKNGDIPGVDIEPVMGRIYPEQKLAAGIIGFVGTENRGLAGIEYAFNDELEAKASDTKEGGQQGNQIVLTIDANVQYILEEIADRVLKQNEAEAVMLMAMNPRNGDILGQASLPSFDPNDFRSSGEQTWTNRPSVWPYEPGSVFKVFALAAVLDSGAITPSATFLCNGRYEHTTNQGEKVLINCMGQHGNVNARQIIMYSCNAGAAYAADKMGADDFYGSVRKLGFGEKTGSGLPGEIAGILNQVNLWSVRTKPTMAMGQEIGVSAMQMMRAATAIANDGMLVSPRVVLAIRDSDGKNTRDYKQPDARRVISPQTAREMRSYMRDVTGITGTGYRANVEDLTLAVKTGTAQMIDSASNTYSDTDFIASCLAILPADNPTLVLYIVIIKPKGSSILGGRIAAPPIREAAEELINYLGIPRGRNPQVSHSGQINLPNTAIPFISDIVPDLTGYSKRALVPLLLRDDIKINLTGEGWVVRQTPPPGTPITATTVITLELE